MSLQENVEATDFQSADTSPRVRVRMRCCFLSVRKLHSLFSWKIEIWGISFKSPDDIWLGLTFSALSFLRSVETCASDGLWCVLWHVQTRHEGGIHHGPTLIHSLPESPRLIGMNPTVGLVLDVIHTVHADPADQWTYVQWCTGVQDSKLFQIRGSSLCRPYSCCSCCYYCCSLGSYWTIVQIAEFAGTLGSLRCSTVLDGIIPQELSFLEYK